MGSLYFIRCIVDQEKLLEMRGKRSDHLEYVSLHEPFISFAGVVESTEHPYQQICYFFKSSATIKVEDFIKNDPYYSCYSDVETLPFTQKIPRCGGGDDRA